MDKLGKLVYRNPDLLFMYKGVVGCPPLQMVDDVLAVQNCSERSQRMNTTINTFMELEKLTLSKKKCHKIHIGKHHRECPDLYVHGAIMAESKSEKYLGDIVHSSGSIKPNLAKRLSRGWGKVSEIMAIVKEAPLGHYRIMAGLILRKAMLHNTMLCNSEAWHGFNLSQVKAFEKIDEALIRGLVQGHAKIAIPALYLETGQIPVRFILACRRIQFLHTILARDSDELIYKVYQAQKVDPTQGDFCELVENDFKLLNLQLSEESLKSMSSVDLKCLLKGKSKEEAFKYLMEIKETKSKLDNISYLNSFKTLKYIQVMSREQSSLLLALKTRTVRGIRSDFGEMFPDKQCPLQNCQELDSLPHLLACRELQGEAWRSPEVQFADVYSEDLERQLEVTRLYSQLLAVRERLLLPPD